MLTEKDRLTRFLEHLRDVFLDASMLASQSSELWQLNEKAKVGESLELTTRKLIEIDVTFLKILALLEEESPSKGQVSDHILLETEAIMTRETNQERYSYLQNKLLGMYYILKLEGFCMQHADRTEATPHDLLAIKQSVDELAHVFYSPFTPSKEDNHHV